MNHPKRHGPPGLRVLITLLTIGFLLFGFILVVRWERDRASEASIPPPLIARQPTRIADEPTPPDYEIQKEPLASSRSLIKLDGKPVAEVSSEQPFLPEDRPEWVAQPDQVVGDIHRIAIGTEPAASLRECEESLAGAMRDGVRRYMIEHLAESRHVPSPLPELSPDWIRQNLMSSVDAYDAVIERPVGTFHQLWVQLEIDPDDRQIMQSWIQAGEMSHRAAVVGIVGGGLILAISILNTTLQLFATKPIQSRI